MIRCIKSSKKYPEFFNLHSMSFAAKDKNEGRKIIEISLMHLKKNLVQILTEDQNVRENAFENELTPEIFVTYVFTLLMSPSVGKTEKLRTTFNDDRTQYLLIPLLKSRKF